MIGHEAVRKDCKLFISCRAQNLHQGKLDGACIEEPLRFRMAAERQEISIETGVVERLQVPGAMGRHACVRATSDPSSG